MKIAHNIFTENLQDTLEEQTPSSFFISTKGIVPSILNLKVYLPGDEVNKLIDGAILTTSVTLRAELEFHEFTVIEKDNFMIWVSQCNNSPISESRHGFDFDNDFDDEDPKPTFSKVLVMFDKPELNLGRAKETEWYKALSKYFQSPIDKDGRKPFANIITMESNRFQLTEFNVSKTDIDIELNYGSEFLKLHNLITTNILSGRKQKGLYLFHGVPGTGKSSYIRELISAVCKKKRVIYLPPDFANSITDPSFITFLLNYPNSVLVIEDAENILRTRSQHSTQAAANLLNLSDGLLSDVLKVQTICTFNCNLKDIDSALLRKGRLIAKHEFGPLTQEQSQKLLDALGSKVKAEKNMTLADIYNVSDLSFDTVQTKIGY